ncbi:hypothetical protein JHK85_010900 [Glycine max]|uniref:Alpha-N-acetylglucosaminidase N-terminal domain-containing protein n=1 Tax=Glycine soja TaxID=3848 RepID=A0A0B2Q8N6_GLYSO|nr:hypothetical protein JHK85_010900 [Glycine max]KAG5066868.1 hypothetical protein JHK86_010599 [Glycine max]KHN16294.1 hypothetical protein glysoja_030269 [Glycine soja]
MKIPFPAIYLIFTFSLPSSTGAGIDTISRLIRIQDRERAPPSVRRVWRPPPPIAFSLLQLPIPDSQQEAMRWRILLQDQKPSFFQNTREYSSNSVCYLIEGTTGVDIVAGLHWYLKHWRGSHVSWDKRDGTPYITPFTIALMEHMTKTEMPS